MKALEQRIQDFLSQLNLQHETVWLAYSGGLDSRVLLQLFATLKSSHPALKLAAIHVNHQLQDEASHWERHCQEQCDALGIPITICRVDASPKDRQSPEEAAREARYEAFAEHLQSGDVLITAHHANDQAETLLLQLMRGAGTAGLSAMPRVREFKGILLHRPLLSFSRQLLHDYAIKHEMTWIEDPSNAETDIRRNYIRHNVIPVLNEQWSGAEKLIAQSSTHVADTQQSLDWFLDNALDEVLLANDVISITQLNSYPLNIQNHLMRRWYSKLGLPAPGSDKLAIIFNEVIHAQEDANPELNWQGGVLHRSKDRLILSPQWPSLESSSWDGSRTVSSPVWNLTIAESESFDSSEISIQLVPSDVEVRFENHSKRLKRLFKEKSMPVKFRSLLPAVFIANELIYIPGVFHHQDYKAVKIDFDFNRLGIESDASAPSQPLLSVLGIA